MKLSNFKPSVLKKGLKSIMNNVTTEGKVQLGVMFFLFFMLSGMIRGYTHEIEKDYLYIIWGIIGLTIFYFLGIYIVSHNRVKRRKKSVSKDKHFSLPSRL